MHASHLYMLRPRHHRVRADIVERRDPIFVSRKFFRVLGQHFVEIAAVFHAGERGLDPVARLLRHQRCVTREARARLAAAGAGAIAAGAAVDVL